MQNFFLPFLGITCRSLGWFPVWLLLLVISQQTQSAVLLCSAMFFGTGLLCGVWQRIRKVVLRHRMRAFSAFLLILPPAAAGAGTFFLTQRIFTACFMPLVMMIFCIKGAASDTAKIYDRTLYIFTLTGAVLTALMFKVTQLNPQTVLMFSLTAAVSAGYLILRNQCMLQRLVSRRNDGGGVVPKDIRRHNLYLVAGILVGLSLLLLLREPVADFFTGIARGLVTLFVMGIKFITSIVSKSEGDPLDGTEADAAQQAEQLAEAGTSSPLWNLIWIPIILVMFFFWRMIFRAYAYDIREWFRKLREQMHRKPAVREFHAETGEYTDTETDALPEDVTGSRAQHRKWAKQFKAWEKTPDSPEKFYAGYQLLLSLPAFEPHPEDADTVLEVLEKWHKYRENELDTVTDEFSSDKYEEKGLASSAVSDMHTALLAVSKLKLNGV